MLISRSEPKLKAVKAEIAEQYPSVKVDYAVADFSKLTPTVLAFLKAKLDPLDIGTLVNNVGVSYDFCQWSARRPLARTLTLSLALTLTLAPRTASASGSLQAQLTLARTPALGLGLALTLTLIVAVTLALPLFLAPALTAPASPSPTLASTPISNLPSLHLHLHHHPHHRSAAPWDPPQPSLAPPSLHWSTALRGRSIVEVSMSVGAAHLSKDRRPTVLARIHPQTHIHSLLRFSYSRLLMTDKYLPTD